MNDLVDFLTSTETMVVYIVVGVACLLCLIVYLLDKSYYKRKRRHNTRELNKVVEKVQEEIGEDTTEVLEPVMSEVEEPKLVVEEAKEELNLEYTNIEPDKTEAQEELQRLTEVLEQAQEEEEKNINLTEFEEEQEKNAIISIDELINKTKAMYESGEFDKYEDEKVNPISLDDLDKKEVEEPVLITLDDLETAKASEEVVSTFKSSPIISPVFGIETNAGTKATEMELENTANYEKLDEEIKKTNEFLMTLKEFQKNLD
ncbi:MAG: hypothetical protein IKG58_02855 [Bacilli bacterium]|nr:hypothetical protein [Bacilli bacterium]